MDSTGKYPTPRRFPIDQRDRVLWHDEEIVPNRRWNTPFDDDDDTVVVIREDAAPEWFPPPMVDVMPSRAPKQNLIRAALAWLEALMKGGVL